MTTHRVKSWSGLRAVAEIARNSPLGMATARIAGRLRYDGVGKLDIPRNLILDFIRDGALDCRGAPSVVRVDSPLSLPYGSCHVFLNTLAVSQDLDDDSSASVVGYFGGEQIKADWFGISHTPKPDSVDNWTRLQSAIDADQHLLGVSLPCWSNKRGINGGYITQPIRIDRKYKRVHGSGRNTKLHFRQLKFTNPNLKGAINMATPRTLNTSRFETGISGIETVFRDDSPTAVFHASSTLEEHTYIRDINIDGFGQYGILLEGGANGLHISDINCAGKGFYSKGTERGFFLKQSPQNNPEGAVSLERITFNKAGPGAPDPRDGVFGFCNRHWGRLRLSEIHCENAEIGYWMDEEYSSSYGHHAYVLMDNCDHRARESTDITLLVSGRGDQKRLSLRCRNLQCLGGTHHTVIQDNQHGVAYKSVGSVHSYERSRFHYQGPRGVS